MMGWVKFRFCIIGISSALTPESLSCGPELSGGLLCPSILNPDRMPGLDEDYQWAVAGNPKLKNLWILSRDPIPDPQVVPAEYSPKIYLRWKLVPL